MPDFNDIVDIVSGVIAQWTPRVLGSLALLISGWMIAGHMKRLARKALSASAIDDILVPFLAGMIHVTIIVLVAIAAVGVLGVNTASFVAVLGAAGLAVALAFQDTFSNFAAGVMLLTFRPFDVGNYVDVGGTAGTVQEVGIFTCLLTTSDNIHIRVPNSKIFGQTIVNYSVSDTRRIDLSVGVGYDDDLGTAIRTCLDVLAADPRVLEDPEAIVAVNELGDSAVQLVVRPWVKRTDYGSTRWDLIRALKENLEAAGCTLPYPQRDVHLHQVS
jgi:small conductance mechanosensitive channel